MTPDQFFTKLKTYFQGLEWGSSGNKIFGNNVFVVPEIPIQQISAYRSPSLFILDLGVKHYPEAPGIGDLKFGLFPFIENVQSAYGEGSMLSANRTADTSNGVGLLPLESEYLAQMLEVTSLDSAKILLLESNSVKTQTIKNNFPLVLRGYLFKVLVSYY